MIGPSLEAGGDAHGGTATPRGERIELAPGSWLEWWPQFLEEAHAARCLECLLAELPLREDVFEIHGRTVPVPRLLCWHGDPGCAYRYSRKTREPAPWTPTLSALRGALRQQLGLDFNGVLANYYRDGRDSMGYHADDEPELGPAADDIAVASLSLGGTRRFLLKRRSDGALRRFDLSDGSLLVMRGRVQQEWRHALPKTRRAVEARLNLTFRVIRR